MKLVVEPMGLEDINQVLEVDRESYTLPWPASAYRREILHNRNARYYVLREVPDEDRHLRAHARDDQRARLPWGFFRRTVRPENDGGATTGHIVGYAGMWMMLDEAHITTIAVREALRGRGLGELLLARLIEAAGDEGAHRVTLEVRVSNESAQNLYRKYGFLQEGIRPRYYSDNNEDAYIMSTGAINQQSYLAMFESHVQRLQQRFERDAEIDLVTSGGVDQHSQGI